MKMDNKNNKSLFLYAALIFFMAIILTIIAFFGQTTMNKRQSAIDNTPIPQPEGISEKASVLSKENSNLTQKVTELEKIIKEKDSEISDLNEKITESDITEYRNNILFNAYAAKKSGDAEKVKEILSELSYDSLNEQQQAAYNELMK